MILSILKIIGVIFLIILALFIFIVSLILFMPVRYWFEGKYSTGLSGEASVKWFPVLLNVTVRIQNDKIQYRIKLLGGVVLTNTDAKLSWLGKRLCSFDEGLVEEETVEQKEGNISVQEPEQRENIKKDEQKVQYFTEEDETCDGVAETSSTVPAAKESLVKKIRRKISMLQMKWKAFRKKLKTISKKKEALIKVYHSKCFQVAKKDLFVYLKKLFKILKPDYVEGFLHFGLEDPAITGQVLGIMAMAMPIYKDCLEIQPDFEGACLDGHLMGRGKIQMISFVILALKIIFNKNLIKVTKKVQTIIEA